MSSPALLYCNDASCDVNLSTMAELFENSENKELYHNSRALTNKVDFLEDRLCGSSEMDKNRQAALEWKTAKQELMGLHDSNGISHITDDNKKAQK